MTRVITFVLANEGSNKPYPFIGVPDGHHDLSHHGNSEEKLNKIFEINKFHIKQLAYLLEKLKSVPEGDGTLLDHVMIAYGSGEFDGNAHNCYRPADLIGGRRVRFDQDRSSHSICEGNTAEQLRWMLPQRMDVKMERLGDSTKS
ncbi:MAG: DUF1552 domain-containing protein [Pirellulales bacterium]